MLFSVKYKISKDMKDKINDLLLKMQTGENCIGETANALLNLYSVSVSLEGTANKLIEVYEERETKASSNGNWSEAFQNEIRVGVLQHLILLHKHNER
tara:strand:+ start:161 stop:454 length:294 start_codon:yes stop_codon:yes gene_type:complete